MALEQNQAQILASVREFTNTAGSTALNRHSNERVRDYINRALGSLHRKLNEAGVGDRYLSSATVTTSNGTATYPLHATFDHLISVDLSANGVKSWLVAYEMHERPSLTDANAVYSGVPYCYRLRGANIEYLPTPAGVYTSTLWFVPTPTNWSTSGSDASSTFDTINRLDDYIIAYASRFIAVKDKNREVIEYATGLINEIGEDIAQIGHARDRNSPPRPVDEMVTNRFGRRVGIPARWR